MPKDLGLLILRLGAGGTMLMAHGLPKMMNFSSNAPNFPDPIGFGPSISLGLAVFAEVFCAFALIIGLGTRLLAIPLIITMLVAFFIIHGADGFAKQELSMMYGMMYIVIFLVGPGKYSVDNIFSAK